jgi:pimeloyl-ACP methyl ester carboxylesterase
MARSFKKTGVSPGTAGAIAAATATILTALWVQHRARKTERENPPAGRFVEVDGVRLHYIEKGQGAPVVLLHGNTVYSQDFIGSGLFDRLAEHHRVIAFDRPGFGYSERPRNRVWTAQAQAVLLQKALAKIDVEQPVVVGHSWGTLVALGMAVDAPTFARGLVLISGYYYPTARLDVALTAPAAVPLVGDVLRYTVSPLTGRLLLKRTVKAMFAPAPMPENFFDVMPREMMLRPIQIRAEAEDAAFMIPAAAHFRHHYSKFAMPVSIFAGAGDLVVDVEAHSARLNCEISHSTLTVSPGAGHMVHYALADEIVDAINLMSDHATMRNLDPVAEIS